MKRIILVLCFLLASAALAEASSPADDFYAGLSQAWNGLLGMADEAGQAASDWMDESGVKEWAEGAANDVSAWFQEAGLTEWADGAIGDISAWFEGAGAWTQETAANLQAFIDENKPAVEAWLVQAGEDVKSAWDTLTNPDGHTEAEVQEAYETVIDSLEDSMAPFARLAGLEWFFASGAGGWSTDLRIAEDGSFSGEFHDSEMGEAADDYPYGTVYCCSFTGQMTFVEYVDEHTWKLRVDRLVADEAVEAIDDGIRYVPTEPYGIIEGDEMLLYLPGTSIDAFTDEMRIWAHLLGDDAPTTLENWFLYSEQNDSGFVGYIPQ